jgi:glutamate-5-semialdehyde dehydrogenase
MSATTPAQAMIATLGAGARAASRRLAAASTADKNRALLAAAETLAASADAIIAENAKDLEAAQASGLSSAAIDRLRLDHKRIGAIAQALREVAALPDPVGEIIGMTTRPSGIRVGRMRAPIGVVGIIYESRPNVTADAAALCLKSGNACILRGGSEAFHSNRAIAAAMARGIAHAGLPAESVCFVATTDREAVGAMLAADRLIDVIIPRGGKPLIERVSREARMPVVKHLDGNCFVYVDEGADHAMAEAIVTNAKCQRPGVCNALETLLVHAAEAPAFVPRVAAALKARDVEIRGCPRTCAMVLGAVPATEEDWDAEYLDLILAVRIVDSFAEAVAFINDHGSHHTDAIVTRDHSRAMRFLREVDSACVHINCSTRFSDGGEYGLGAEIGISTDRLHARGPMGLAELTTPKWIVFGDGEVRG